MKKFLKIYAVGMAINIFIAYAFNDHRFDNSYMTALGLINLVAALLTFVTGLIVMAIDKEIGQAILIASGLFLVTGTLSCSVFPLRLHA